MISVAVVEDQVNDFLQLKQTLTFFFETEKIEFSLIHYKDALYLLNNYHSQFHLIFMDIDLPKINGMEAAKQLRKRDRTVNIVFLTKLIQFAINGYEVNALDYILKPVNQYSFSLKMKKVLSYIKKNNCKEITIMVKNAIYHFYTTDIFYIEIISHQLIYHTQKGNFSIRGTMTEAETLFSSYNFKRCNNCYLVNLMYVTGIQGNKVLINSSLLQISRSRKKEFITAITNYLGGSF